MMNKKKTVLAHLPINKKAIITELHGGGHFNRRMCAVGLRKGQTVETISKQPFMGPLTIQVGKCKMTIGRGMAHKIYVEMI